MKEEPTNLKVATLAGGCFWCLAADFEKVSGFAKVVSGYAGGQKENPLGTIIDRQGGAGNHESASRECTRLNLRTFEGQTNQWIRTDVRID
jgi:Peptide methionine sulfoxide reductase